MIINLLFLCREKRTAPRLRLSWREKEREGGEKKTSREESVCSENEVYVSGGIRAEVE